jgi:molecular chaperone HscB
MDLKAQPNYFEFFGLPVALFVDAAALRRAYLENSRKHHPDFHTLASAEAQDQSLVLSTLNNEAFKTLADPDLRLQYVLRLHGMLADAGEADAIPQEFLMEMMDINEKIMELEFDPSPTLYQEAVAASNSLESSLEASVEAILSKWTAATGTAAELAAAKVYFLKKKYLLRVKENLSKFAPAFE